MSKKQDHDLDYDDLQMLSQYIQNQQQVINELMEKKTLIIGFISNFNDFLKDEIFDQFF